MESQIQSVLPTQLQEYVHKSRYARWIAKEKRREHWHETVERYTNYFASKFPHYPKEEIYNAIVKLEVMPSMRAMMTAGPALERDPMAGYNCSFIAIDDVRAFDEILYILMCFHPDTQVVTRNGNKRIADIMVGDEVASIDESTGQSIWKKVTNQIKTQSAHKPKVEVILENGHSIKCTADHKWLTTNRGWVEAEALTSEDDLVAPGWQIYRITNSSNGKSYIGQTTKTAETRFKEHKYLATLPNTDWHFAKAIRKYDPSVWKLEVIDFAFSQTEANEKECNWIIQYDSLLNGYNSTVGGEGASGYKWTPEQRKYASENAYERTEEQRENQRQVLAKAQEKIIETRQTPEYREAQRQRNLGENNPMFGKQLSDERKAELSLQNTGEANAFFGKHHSEETKQKIRENRPDTSGKNNPYFGKKHSEATRAKMRASWAKRAELKGATV
jgi:group I intron endonuclease